MSSAPSCTPMRPDVPAPAEHQPPSLAQPFLHGDCGCLYFGKGGANGRNGGELPFDQRLQNVRRLPNIYARVARTGAFCGHLRTEALMLAKVQLLLDVMRLNVEQPSLW